MTSPHTFFNVALIHLAAVVLSAMAALALFALAAWARGRTAAVLRVFSGLRRDTLAALFVAAAVATVAAQKSGGDRGGGASPSSSPPTPAPIDVATNEAALAISSFAVDGEWMEVGFGLTWAGNLFDAAASRSLDLFMSTNLQTRGWWWLGGFEMPQGATSHVFSVSAADVDARAREAFTNAFGRVAFFRFGAAFDADGDGLADSYETLVSLTDPTLADTDGDGLSDGEEAVALLNPLARDTDSDGFLDGTDCNPLDVDSWEDADGDGLPDAWKDGWFGTNAVVGAFADANTNGVSNFASLLIGLNPVAPSSDGFSFACGGGAAALNAWEIVPIAFDFARPCGLTNLLSRTFAVRRESPWEQFFVSARPDAAAGWEMSNVLLLYGVDDGPPTNAVPSESADSWRVPLGGVMPQTMSFRVEATGGRPALSSPLYLLRWTPHVEFLPSENVTVVAGTNGHAYAAAKRDAGTGEYEIPFVADLSKCPHFAGIDAEAAAELSLPPVDGLSVSAGPATAFVASDPMMADLPPEGTNLSKRLLLYDVDLSRSGAVSSGPRASQYASPYPLTSSSLRKSFHAATGEIADGSVTLTLAPDVPELGFVAEAPALRGGTPRLGASSGGARSGTVEPPARITPTVCGQPCTNDVWEVECEYPEDHDEVSDEDDDPAVASRDDCECCEDGGTSLGSFRIRIPLGESAADERLGYLWASVDGPAAISPSTFRVLAAPRVVVATNANGTLSISGSAAGGRTLLVTNIANGVAIPVWNASGRFESQWTVWNENGDASTIRVRKTTVLGNATVDETFSTWAEAAPVLDGETMPPATVWRKRDNIRGLATTRYEWRDQFDPDFIEKEYEETALGDELVGAECREYVRIGAGAMACRRLARAFGYDEMDFYDEERTYWCDAGRPERHARLMSIRSNRQPWSWHDYDDCGREIVRIEQMDGSPFPELAEVSLHATLPQGCSAKVTVTDYTAQAGDGEHRNDSFEPREIVVYVRPNGGDPVAVSHETRVYTRETDGRGVPVRRVVKTLGLDGLVRAATTVEYPQDGEVPPYLRGRTVLSTNADGSTTSSDYVRSNGFVVATSRTAFNGVGRQTYTRTVSDAAFRLPAREETRLSANDAILEWSERTYDDIRRLRSVSYSDGTSETNAYSCCRLLWRRDRDGRTVLRSAQTGTDSLYYADENMWLSGVSADGSYRIVQHRFDGLGRETNAVTHLGFVPGEATCSYTPSATRSPSSRAQEIFSSFVVERVDERGSVSISGSHRLDGAEQSWESFNGADGSLDALVTTVVSLRNGGTDTETWWSGGWRRETRSTSYRADGTRVESAVVVASDHAAVTNSVQLYDALGRQTAAWTPSGATEFVYDGTSSRMLRMEYAAGTVERTSYIIRNAAGEQVGTVLDGVTNRTDVTYEELSNAWWRVTTEATVGPNTNSVSVLKEQMTGLGGGLRGRKVSVDATGLETFTELTFNADTQIETESEVRSDGTWKTTRRKHGLVLEIETASGRTVNTYDGFGRVIGVWRSVGTGGDLQPVSRTEYAPWGDVTAVETHTNGTDVVRESYAYDVFGNCVAATNALGEVVETDYDVFGNVTAKRGATYPVEMDYDTENRRTALRTTRDGVTWDETRWTYDAATGLLSSKTYADNSTVTYTYTPDNLPLRTTYASGRWKENMYDERRKVVAVEYSDGETVSLAYDAFLNEIAFSNDVAAANLDRDAKGSCTNETTVVGEEVKTTRRTFDAFSRMTGIDGIFYDYNAEGLLASISNDIVLVEYAYTPDHLDAGYSLTLSNGVVFTRSIVRDGYRRSLVTNISGVANGVGVGSLAYTYDALNRPATRNNDTFDYNARSEVTAANVSGVPSAYGYDEIGNSTNWTANCLNQYTEFTHDADGNMTQCGDWTYTYDAANRLKTASSNGVLIVTNFYDAKSRRVKKVTQDTTMTFFYDGWNLVEERISYTNGTTSTIHYYWGKDLSGTLQGAGGVGGLLYLTVDGVPYIPDYDNIGNITRYLDANGNVVAQYTYDAFGGTLSQSGTMCDVFRHRFSTKYVDIESSLYYYGYRFYHPPLMRWLNRDPIGEDGGVNIYGFCKNVPLMYYDIKGEDIYLYTGNDSWSPINNMLHQAVAVDVWSDDCPPVKIGIRGFSFAFFFEFKWNWGSKTWLGQPSVTLPGLVMVGEIYDIDDVPGKVVKQKHTTYQQDKAWLEKMESRVGTKDVYSVGRHNCRAFSQAEFEKAP